MKSEYKTFREAYEAYVNPETRYSPSLCIVLCRSDKLLKTFKDYYDPELYSDLVIKTDQIDFTFMSTTEETDSYKYTQAEIDRRATALAFLAAMEEAGDL